MVSVESRGPTSVFPLYSLESDYCSGRTIATHAALRIGSGSPEDTFAYKIPRGSSRSVQQPSPGLPLAFFTMEAHSSQHNSNPVPGQSRFVTPPPAPPPAPDPAPVFRATVDSELGGNPDADPSPPRDRLSDNPKFLHPATPRRAKISTIDVLHKDKGYYTEMGNREMEHRYAQVDLKTFFDKYVPRLAKSARPLSAAQRKKIGNFSQVPFAGPEERMYAPLVRGTTLHLCRSL